MPATSGSLDPASGTPPASARPASGLRWRRVFPGEERQLGVLRRWLTSLCPACPARDDLAMVANELSSNAIRHTASGRGGWFAVEVAWAGPVVRVTVADSGAATEPHVIDDPGSELIFPPFPGHRGCGVTRREGRRRGSAARTRPGSASRGWNAFCMDYTSILSIQR